jgi:hypothetical protein
MIISLPILRVQKCDPFGVGCWHNVAVPCMRMILPGPEPMMPQASKMCSHPSILESVAKIKSVFKKAQDAPVRGCDYNLVPTRSEMANVHIRRHFL